MTAGLMEEKIRKRAEKENEKAIRALFEPIQKALYPAGMTHKNSPRVQDKANRHPTYGELLTYIQNTLVEETRKKVGDQAIESFIKKVDDLQDQLDELANSVR